MALYESAGPGYGRYTHQDGSSELMLEEDARQLQALAQQEQQAADQQALAAATASPPPPMAPPPPAMEAPPEAMLGATPPAGGIVDPFAPLPDQGPTAQAAGKLAAPLGAIGDAIKGVATAAGGIAGPPAPPALSQAPGELPAEFGDTAPLPGARPGEIENATRSDVYADGVAAINMKAGAEAKNAEIRAQGLDEANVEREKVIADAAAIAQEYEQKRIEREKKMEALASRYDQAVNDFHKMRVDRSDYRVSLGEVLGVVMAGIGSAYKKQGDKNPALDILTKKIDQYVEDKYKQKASFKEGVDLIGKQIGDQRQAITDVINTPKLLKAALWDDAAQRFASIAERTTSALERDRLHSLSADAYGQAAKLKAELVEHDIASDEKAAQLAESRRQANLASWTSRANNRDSIAAADRRAKADRDAAAAQAAGANLVADYVVAQGPDGKPVYYQARDEVAGRKVVAGLAATKTTWAITQEMVRLKQQYPKLSFYELLKTPEGQQFNANAGYLTGVLKEGMHLGALDNGVERLVNKATGGNLDNANLANIIAQEIWQGKQIEGLRQLGKNQVRYFNDMAQHSRLAGTPFVKFEPIDTTQLDDAKSDSVDRVVDKIKQNRPLDDKAPAASRSVGRGTEAVVDALTPDASEVTLSGDWKEIANEKNVRDTVDPQAIGLGFQVSPNRGAGVRALAKAAAGTGGDAARARTALEGMAMDTSDAGLAGYALDRLASIGAAESLERVKTARTGAAKTRAEEESADLFVDRAAERYRKAAADPIADLGRRAASDPAARYELSRIAYAGGAGAERALAELRKLEKLAGGR